MPDSKSDKIVGDSISDPKMLALNWCKSKQIFVADVNGDKTPDIICWTPRSDDESKYEIKALAGVGNYKYRPIEKLVP